VLPSKNRELMLQLLDLEGLVNDEALKSADIFGQIGGRLRRHTKNLKRFGPHEKIVRPTNAPPERLLHGAHCQRAR
jgi:hypothetical protein